MWVAKFRAWHDSYMLRATASLDVRLRVYYLNLFREGGVRYLNKIMFFEGGDSAKALREVVKDPRCNVLEVHGNQLFYYLRESEGFHNLLFDHHMFFVGPAIVEGGFEYWTVASDKKRHLLSLYKKLNRLPYKARIELLSVRKETPRFFASSALEELTELERRTLETARQQGYYSFPRKANAKEIAAKLGIPASTLTERLRKAEAKLVPAVLDSR